MAGTGYDISASASQSSSAATGAQKLGSIVNAGIVGGSNGVPTWIIYVAGAVIVFLLFNKRK